MIGNCETCQHWKANDKATTGIRAGVGLSGYCHKHCAPTGDTGHCAWHVKRRAEVVPIVIEHPQAHRRSA